jgi:hypothetical protein
MTLVSQICPEYGRLCGHGQGWGYIWFESGTTFFGDFDEIYLDDDDNKTIRIAGVFEVDYNDPADGHCGMTPNEGSWVIPVKKSQKKKVAVAR